MFTPQEVSDKVFPRSSFGGYNMASVDEFLDTLTEDYTALYKDNAILKSKLKVLAEKIEEYRATEDAMRSTLLSAQKMAAQMVQDAQTEKQQIIDQMQQDTQQRKLELAAEIAEQEEKLALAQQKLAEFINRSQVLCAEQAAFLKDLPEACVEELHKSQNSMTAETIRIIESDILKSYDADDAAPADEDTTESAAQDTQDAAPAAEEGNYSSDFNLDDLKFGHNYENLTKPQQ